MRAANFVVVAAICRLWLSIGERAGEQAGKQETAARTHNREKRKLQPLAEIGGVYVLKFNRGDSSDGHALTCFFLDAFVAVVIAIRVNRKRHVFDLNNRQLLEILIRIVYISTGTNVHTHSLAHIWAEHMKFFNFTRTMFFAPYSPSKKHPLTFLCVQYI